MGASQRRKGAKGERELARYAREQHPDLFPEARRGIGQSRSAGEVPDAVIDDEHWPEIKRQARCYPRRALQQAIDASAKSGRTPVAICRDDNDKLGWTVTLRIDDWAELVRAKRLLDSVCVRTAAAAQEELGSLGPIADEEAR